MNPYHEEPGPSFRPVADLFGKVKLVPTKKRVSERSALLEYFAQKSGRTIGHIAYRLTGLNMDDLYYLKSSADAYEREGKGPWTKAFWGALKPREVSTTKSPRS